MQWEEEESDKIKKKTKPSGAYSWMAERKMLPFIE